MVSGETLKLVSLGQGQGPIAEALVNEGSAAGHWVCLQNCHLSVSWLPKLDRLVEELRDSDSVHDDFRLWLTTMPTADFPASVLQSSLKLTQEPPKGLKANLSRSYADMEAEAFEACTKPAPYKKLLFGLAFFNAVIQERRKYGAVGWNIPYQWMASDFAFAQQNLGLMLDEQPSTPFEALNVIISDVVYGGRVTDAQDVRLTRAVLSTYLNADAVDDDDYSFCPQLDCAFRYGAPAEGPLDSYRSYIGTFPLIDQPEIFGLHQAHPLLSPSFFPRPAPPSCPPPPPPGLALTSPPLHQNADITFQQKETGEMMEAIISLQPRESGGSGGKSSDELVGETVDDILAKLPKELDPKSAHEATFARLADGSMNPLGIFFSHELAKFNG